MSRSEITDGDRIVRAIESLEHEVRALDPGVELRDRFAMAALTSSLFHPLSASELASSDLPLALAGYCYEMADAMLAERAKGAK